MSGSVWRLHIGGRRGVNRLFATAVFTLKAILGSNGALEPGRQRRVPVRHAAQPGKRPWDRRQLELPPNWLAKSNYCQTSPKWAHQLNWHRCLTLFEIWLSGSTSFDIQFMPVSSLFFGFGMALRMNDSNLTKHGEGVSEDGSTWVCR